MDKYEYKVRADEINALIAEGKFAEAVKLADTIDWRRVKSVMMLCKISDLYKINRRYQESRDILLLAYEKHPTGRLIVYSLCELSIKMEDCVQAIEYYKEFVQIAPRDTGRYILQYRLYEAQDVSLEERIAVLEEFKKRDYREKWAYELAYLYHRIGLSTKCVEECDEMFLWFGEGKYVIKALELKKLHVPLNADQQDKYDLWMQAKESEAEPFEEEPEEENYEEDSAEGYPGDGRYEDEEPEDTMQEPPTMELPEVKTVDLGQYNTINLQMALAESMQEILAEEAAAGGMPEEDTGAFFNEDDGAGAGYIENGYDGDEAVVEELLGEEEPLGKAADAVYEEPEAEPQTGKEYLTEAEFYEEPEPYEESQAEPEAEPYEEPQPEPEAEPYEEPQPEPGAEPASYGEPQAEPVLYEEPAAEEESYEEEQPYIEPAPVVPIRKTVKPTAVRKVKPAVYVEPEPAVQEPVVEEEPAEDEDEEVPGDDEIVKSLIAPLLQETIRLPDHREVEKQLQETPVTQIWKKADVREAKEPPKSRKPVMTTDNLQEISAQIVHEDTASFDARQILEQMKQEAAKEAAIAAEENRIPGARTGVLTPLNTKPSKYDNFLAQEYDGQISLVMPEAERVEKQITGQLSIEDIMAEWEEMKKTNEQKRMEDVRQRILEHTGNLFADFDEATKNGLLEELERAFVAAIMKESGKKPSIRKVVLPDDTDKKKPKWVEPEPEPVAEEPEDDFEEEIFEPEEPETLEEPDAEEVPAEEPQKKEAVSRPERAAVEVQEPEPEQPVEDTVSERELTAEEKELFGEFIHHRKTERQLVRTLDNMSLSPYTGNVLITGEEDEETLTLAKALIREMQLNDNNFSGKVAKISGTVLNKKDVEETFGRLNNGALIIENASRLKPPTAAKMAKALDKDNRGLIVLMLDKKPDMSQLFSANTALGNYFNLRVDIEALDDEALVAYAKQYAEELEYSIDEFGILALHTRIADMQTSDHEVNTADVRELVDEAIYHANKKTPGHFMDILLAKRYDEDDMIILREKDFIH